jgi:plastocyanin
MKTILLLIACIALEAQVTRANIYSVLVKDYSFTPATVTAEVGDTIRWIWQGGSHTTTSTTIPAGAAPWDSPITPTNAVFQYILTVPGTYLYLCTPHASLSMTGIIVVSPTSVESVENFPLRIAPNPANDVLEVALPGQKQDVEIRILDMLGRSVFDGIISSGKTMSISTANIPSGLYQLTLNLEGRRIANSVVIQH